MEKLSSNPRRLALGGMVVGLVILAAVVVLGRDRDGASRAASPPGAPAAPSAAARPSAAVPQLPGATEQPEMPEELMARILKKDTRLATFMDYHKTVLMDAPRRAEYRKLLASADMMSAMADALMDPGTGKVQPEEYYHRLMQVDYFEAALGWKDNPEREKVLAVTAQVIAKDQFVATQDAGRRQLLGGTKMELYRLMYEQDPRRAEALVASARGSRMEPLLSWMAGEELRRRTREAEIVKEVEALQSQAN